MGKDLQNTTCSRTAVAGWVANYRHRVLGLLVLAMILVGCTSPVGFESSGALAKQLVEATAAQADTLIPSSTATATETATITATPSPSPTATSTFTPTPTPTPVHTPVWLLTPTQTQEPTATPQPTATYPPPPEAVNVPILMYHYISELPPDADVYRRDLTVAPTQFEAHLQYLQAQGYQSVTLADVYATLTTGKPLPLKPVVLTFDDGYKDAMTGAFPLLQKYGFTGEFFILATPAHYEAPNYLSWEDVRTMAEAGMSMQAHGRDHYDLTNRDYDFLVYQILGAKEAVEAHSGQPVRFFCYPSGRYDEDTAAVVESAGYWGAVTTAWGTELRLDNRFAWPRIRVKGNWSLEQYTAVLEQVTP